MTAPRFDELHSLPYVTLTEYAQGSRKTYYNQRFTEFMCLSEPQYAAGYDWVMLADIDEYLWLPKKHDGIKALLEEQQALNMTYVSFGKHMYTLDHRTDEASINRQIDTRTQDPPFPLSKYPFYMKYFCYGKKKGEPNCPTWKGRAKVFVKPSHHHWVDVHGIYYHPKPSEGAVHFHPKSGHFMEWPNIFGLHNITKRPPRDFAVEGEKDVHIHNLELSFKTDINGQYPVEYDDTLEQWFQYVINRARFPSPAATTKEIKP